MGESDQREEQGRVDRRGLSRVYPAFNTDDDQSAVEETGERMDSFGSSSPSRSSASQPSPEVIMNQLQNQLAQAYAEQFLEIVRGKCFDKCITKPGSSLGGSESSCISRCVDRYIEATQTISRVLFSQKQ